MGQLIAAQLNNDSLSTAVSFNRSNQFIVVLVRW